MTVGEAVAAARRWVNAQMQEDWIGAYLSGSVVGADPLALQSPSSDVDITVILPGEAPMKPGKFLYEGALLEVTYLSQETIATPELVLSTYELAGSFRVNTILADPTGALTRLQQSVAAEFSKPQWVRIRYQAALDKIRRGIEGYRPTAPFSDRVLSWLFPTAVTTHVLLAAAQENPTVRLRYPAVRRVLEARGLQDFYPELLQLLGCANLSARQVSGHLERLERTFDAAVAVAKTPFPFSSDITAWSRPVAIDGSKALVEAGDHREAVFWTACTFARCHKIFAVDAPGLIPELIPELIPDFEALMADMGMKSEADFEAGCQRTLAFLPRLERVAEQIATL